MKRCPECRRDYFDDTLSFCLADGAELVYGLADDEPATAILSEPPASEGSDAMQKPAREQGRNTWAPDNVLPNGQASAPQPPATVPTRRDTDSHTALRLNSIIAGVLGLIIVTALGVGSYLYYNRGSAKQIDSIAVMPFVNESGNAEVDYLSDGMTESLIGSLSQLPNLNVKARSSVFRYKGREADSKTIGKELGVQAILSGRVVQRGQDLILYVELVDAQTENSLWKQTYNKTMTNLVALQNDIARDVADKLKIKLSGVDEQKLAKNYTENPEAYQLYLRGRFHWYKRTEKDFQKAAEYFRQAITLDPDYARAYAGLADLHASGGAFKQDPALRLEQLSTAREAALKAVSLDDNLAEAHTALGTILASADYDFVGAEREYRRAIGLNPNYADAHYWYGMILSRLGRSEESFAEFQRALKLEPFNLLYQALYGANLAWAGRYDEGINQLEKTRELDENFPPTLGNLATSYELAGKYDKAIEVRVRELELTGFAQDAAAIRHIYAKGGWVGYVRYLTSPSRPAWVSSYGVAIAHIGLDERNEAIAALSKSYENREGQAQRLKVDPRLDPLRGDPRFRELLRKVGFPE